MFKLHNTTHMTAQSPRDALNVDVVRNCTTFDSVAALSSSYQTLCRVFGPPLYVKNTHGRVLKLEKGEFVPRSVDVYFSFTPGCTWGELLGKVDLGTRAKLKQQTDEGGAKHEWDCVMAAVANEKLRASDACMVVECKLMLQPYLDLLKMGGFLAKVTGAGGWVELQRFFE